MDAFAVALAAGIKLGRIDFRQNFRLAWHFGFFQAAMPVAGWAAGLTVRNHIERFDHWVAFALLAFVAQGMLREGFKPSAKQGTFRDPTRGLTMVMLALATSLDALAVGLSLSMIQVAIWTPALIIGIVAAGFTTVGLHLGKRFAKANKLRCYADTIGAVVLIAIGFNILYEHGVFG
ncbi:MAG: manganese efflux pump [Desulfatitalea sp.]|nr:manganese efflux pump MntP family protein [Desulfatitalea sp.]NNK01010.1 manganese efflux pump [Desulfatitalea sp.]